MIEKVKKEEEGFKIIQADAAHLPFQRETVDLIASNLAYQWVDNLHQAFARGYQSLKKPGTLYVTMFGHNTFKELFYSLERSRDVSDKDFLIQRLAGHNKIQQAIKNSGFNDVELCAETIHGHFPDMMTLIKWIKDMGANTLERNFYIGRDWMMKASDYYEENFSDQLGVQVTFEVIWIRAKK